MKKNRFIFLVFPIIALFLELLPYGAVLAFGNPEGEPWIQTYSYFSLMPVGYANVTPFITAVITCLVLLLLVIYLFLDKEKLAVVARNILWVGVAFSFGSLLFGLRFYSFVGLLISLSLGAGALLLQFSVEKE